MVRFSDLLGHGGDDDEGARASTPTEPVPAPPDEPPPPPPASEPATADDLIDRLTAYAMERGAPPQAPTEATTPSVSNADYVGSLPPVDDDLLPDAKKQKRARKRKRRW
jgi:hypothetical protein